MKTHIKFMLLVLSASFKFTFLFSQIEDETSKLSPYLFPEFLEGSVIKNGASEKMMLNYNTVTEEMISNESGHYEAIPSNTDSVIINGHTFVPVQRAYYEFAVKGNIPLYIQYKGTVELPGQNGNFGIKAQTASTNNAILTNKTILYNLKLPVNYTLTNDKKYFIKKGEQLIRISNQKQLQAIFPKNVDKIKEFAKSNNINFDNADDVKRLIIYANSLVN